MFKASYLSDKKQCHLFQIQVHPEFQDQKIGSYLINNLIHKANEQGKDVGLSALKSNPAFNLYKKLGLKIVKENQHEFELVLKAYQ